MVRWVLGGIVCVIAGGIFLAKYFAAIPAMEKLTTVTGEVTSADVEVRRTRRMQSQHLAVRIADRPVAYYLSWFPDFERIATSIKPGDRVTALVDVGNNYIW